MPAGIQGSPPGCGESSSYFSEPLPCSADILIRIVIIRRRSTHIAEGTRLNGSRSASRLPKGRGAWRDY